MKSSAQNYKLLWILLFLLCNTSLAYWSSGSLVFLTASQKQPQQAMEKHNKLSMASHQTYMQPTRRLSSATPPHWSLPPPLFPLPQLPPLCSLHYTHTQLGHRSGMHIIHTLNLSICMLHNLNKARALLRRQNQFPWCHFQVLPFIVNFNL